MKSTVVALSLLTSIAAAAPQAGADLKGGYGKYSSYGSYNGAPADYKPPMDDAPKVCHPRPSDRFERIH